MMRSFHEALSSPHMTTNGVSASFLEKGEYFLRNNRIISKIFQAKDKEPETIVNNNNNNDESNRIDVNAVTQDVDILLEGKSPDDCKQLLTSMISDLLHEVDTLRFRLEQSDKQNARLKEERDTAQNDYRDRLLAILLALQSTINEPMNDIHNVMMNGSGETNDDGTKKCISADEATTLTIQSLTNKIEKINVENTNLHTEIHLLNEQIDDFKSDGDAKEIKINALETQFKMINKKRSKVVSKFTDITNSFRSSNKQNTTDISKMNPQLNNNLQSNNNENDIARDIPLLKKPPRVRRVGQLLGSN